MKKKIFFLFSLFLVYFLFTNISSANVKKKIITNLEATKTLFFNFKQIISDEEESGSCFIKYPLLMKCRYENLKQKVIISNGKTVAIIKKKYKKIYYYPIKSTPLSFILQRNKIINLIKQTEPIEIDSNLIAFGFIDKNKNEVKILFDKNLLQFRGWKTKDAYSNEVNFEINDLIINRQIVDSFFKIPQEKDL